MSWSRFPKHGIPAGEALLYIGVYIRIYGSHHTCLTTTAATIPIITTSTTTIQASIIDRNASCSARWGSNPETSSTQRVQCQMVVSQNWGTCLGVP